MHYNHYPARRKNSRVSKSKTEKLQAVLKKAVFPCFFFLFITAPLTGSSQTVSFKSSAASLDDVAQAVKKQTGYSVFYNAELAEKLPKTKIDAQGLQLKDFLNRFIKDLPIQYSISNTTVVIYESHEKKVKTSEHNDSIRSIIKPSLTLIELKVSDTLGQPLEGATVYKSGKLLGATTKFGLFSLEASEGEVLTVSYVGFYTEFIKISQSVISNGKYSITLKPVVNQLEEIETISTGYQKIRPEQSTGSISIITQKDYDSRINTTDFLLGLQNKIPGLLINDDVQFEGNDLFQIRGISTINGNKQPLIVVDGFPTELSLDMINPYEIESVTVLKDAAAATVYGARAANGVIIVERKKANIGKPRVAFQSTATITPKDNYDRFRWDKNASATVVSSDSLFNYNISSLGWYLMTNPNYSDLYSYSPTAQIMAHWRASSGAISVEERDKELAQLASYNNTKDYAKEFLRTELSQTYNLSISGGSQNAMYYITGAYNTGHSQMIKNENDQAHLSVRTVLSFSKRFSLDLNNDFSETRYSYAPLLDINSLLPYEHLRDSAGNPLPIYNGSYVNSFYNSYIESLGLQDNMYYPLKEMNEVSNKVKIINNRLTANFRYNIGSGFNFNFGGVYEISTTDQKHLADKESAESRQLTNRYTVYDAVNKIYTSKIPSGGILEKENISTESYTLRAQLNYDRNITKDHSLNIILGGEIRSVIDQSNSEAYFGYDDQTLIQQSVDYASLTNFVPSYSRANPALSFNQLFNVAYDENRYVSVYSNAVYSYKNKYSVSGSIRIDQSNLFGTDPKYRYKPLWSLGGAWNIQKEKILENVSWLKQLKYRMAYGFDGNVAKNSLPQVIASAGLTNSLGSIYNLNMLSLLSPANSGLRWEQTANLNFGIDYAVFKNITGSIDYYLKKSKDILAANQIDVTQGVRSAIVNKASISNRGFEFNLHADWITRRKFNWNTGFIFSKNSSKVIEVYNNNINSTSSSLSYVTGSNANYLKGYPVGAVFAYRYAGIDSLGAPQIYDKDGIAKGFGKGVDNGIKDVKFMGTTIPAFNLGLSNRIDIGRFYFYCMIHYFAGFKVRIPVPTARTARPLEGAGNFWKQPGDENKAGILPAIGNAYYSYLQYTDKYIVNGAYITLGDLTGSYTFKQNTLLKKAGANIELRGQVSNLFTKAFNNYNFSVAMMSYAKSYITPIYTLALRITF